MIRSRKTFNYIYTYKLGVHTTSYFSSEIKHAFEIPESVVSFQNKPFALLMIGTRTADFAPDSGSCPSV